MFAWKTLKRALPVGARLVERHIDFDPRCKRCGESESIIHLLFHCPYAQQVWHDAPLARGFDPRGIVDLEASWTALCATPSLPPSGVVSSHLVPWILWIIWKERKNFVFKDCSASAVDCLTLAIKSAKEWDLGLNVKKVTYQKPPPVDVQQSSASTVVRTDAAWRKEDKKAGLGWTVRSVTSHELRQKKQVEHVSSALMAEGLAIREALLCCRRQGLNSIHLKSDSSQLISAINRKEPLTKIHGILSDILNLCCSPLMLISFSWIPRDQNFVADSLSKEALCMVGAFTAPT